MTIAMWNVRLQRLTVLLCGVCALAVFCYAAFLLMAVAHAARITGAEQHIATLKTDVSKLQSEYLAATKALTPERAAALGFVVPEVVVAVYASTPALSLNFPHESR